MLFSPARVHGDLPRQRPHLHRRHGWRPTCWPSRSAMAPPDVADPRRPAEGWHGARLRRSAASASGLRVARVDFAGPAASRSAAARRAAGRARRACRGAVLVRSIPAGSFEQVTLRLGLLHALEALGVTVVNTARGDRALRRQGDDQLPAGPAGLPTPPTWAVESPDAAAAASCEARRRSGTGWCSSRCSARRAEGLRLRRAAGRPAGAGARSAASTTCSASSPGRERRLARLPGLRDRRQRGGGDGAARRQLDHQRRPGRRARARAGRGPAGRARGGGRRGRRRGPRRRRPDRGPRRRAAVLEVNSMPAWQGLQSVSERGHRAAAGPRPGRRASASTAR